MLKVSSQGWLGKVGVPALEAAGRLLHSPSRRRKYVLLQELWSSLQCCLLSTLMGSPRMVLYQQRMWHFPGLYFTAFP